MRYIVVLATAALLLAGAACTVEVTGRGGTSDTEVSAGDPDALRFRPVLRSAPVGAAPSAGTPTTTTPAPTTTSPGGPRARQGIDPNDPAAVQAALATFQCVSPDPLAGADVADQSLLTCDEAGENAYLLGPTFLTGAEIDSASASPDSNGGTGYLLTVEFSTTGARVWGEFTTANVGKQVAIVLDTTVLSAPAIQEAILGGSTVINGGRNGFTREEARELAARLGGG